MVTALSAFSQSRYVQIFRLETNQLYLIAERIDPGMATYSIASFEGLIGKAALTRQVVWAPDVSMEPTYIAAEKSTKSELVIPALKELDGVTYVVNIERDVPHAYSHAQIQWLTEFVDAYPFSQQTSDVVPPREASPFDFWFYVSYARADRDRTLDQFLVDVTARSQSVNRRRQRRQFCR